MDLYFDPNPAEIRLIDSNRVNQPNFLFTPTGRAFCYRRSRRAHSLFRKRVRVFLDSHISRFFPTWGRLGPSKKHSLASERDRNLPSPMAVANRTRRERSPSLQIWRPPRAIPLSIPPSLPPSLPRFFDATSSRSIRGAMKLFDDLPSMDHLRSEDMSLVQVIIPVESAHRAVSYLGELGLLQLKDVRNPKPVDLIVFAFGSHRRSCSIFLVFLLRSSLSWLYRRSR